MPQHSKVDKPTDPTPGYLFNALEERVYNIEERNEKNDAKKQSLFSTYWWPVILILIGIAMPYIMALLVKLVSAGVTLK